GYIPQHPDWMRGMGLSDEETAHALLAMRGPLFHYLRQRTAYCFFEHALYSNPSQNLHQLMAQTEAKILGCQENASPRWAANAWFVSFPVYWHNYVIADMIASQIHGHLNHAFGELFNTPAAFKYCIDTYISPGARLPWLEKIARGTGHSLSAAALIKDLSF
ncbi:MAG: hypothetical protein Q8N36_03090, partial [bacterium]|nr:hypothetical protein [bacterium]